MDSFEVECGVCGTRCETVTNRDTQIITAVCSVCKGTLETLSIDMATHGGNIKALRLCIDALERKLK